MLKNNYVRLLQPLLLRLGTLNIGTMTVRRRELSDCLKRRGIDIACVQEVKWTGGKTIGIGEGYKLFYNGGLLKQNGVGVAVSQRLCDSVVEVRRVSDCLMTVKIDSGPNTLLIVSGYAPQQGCTDEAKDAFWTSMGDNMRSFVAEEHLFIGGDLNGHVGHERHGYEKYHVGQGLGARNEEGYRRMDFAETHELALVNTFFKKRMYHLITYCSGPRTSQVNYLLVRRPDLRHVKNAKVIPSDNVAQHHRLLTMDICLDIGQRRPVRKTGVKKIKMVAHRQIQGPPRGGAKQHDDRPKSARTCSQGPNHRPYSRLAENSLNKS